MGANDVFGVEEEKDVSLTTEELETILGQKDNLYREWLAYANSTVTQVQLIPDENLYTSLNQTERRSSLEEIIVQGLYNRFVLSRAYQVAIDYYHSRENLVQELSDLKNLAPQQIAQAYSAITFVTTSRFDASGFIEEQALTSVEIESLDDLLLQMDSLRRQIFLLSEGATRPESTDERCTNHIGQPLLRETENQVSEHENVLRSLNERLLIKLVEEGYLNPSFLKYSAFYRNPDSRNRRQREQGYAKPKRISQIRQTLYERDTHNPRKDLLIEINELLLADDSEWPWPNLPKELFISLKELNLIDDFLSHVPIYAGIPVKCNLSKLRITRHIQVNGDPSKTLIVSLPDKHQRQGLQESAIHVKSVTHEVDKKGRNKEVISEFSWPLDRFSELLLQEGLAQKDKNNAVVQNCELTDVFYLDEQIAAEYQGLAEPNWEDAEDFFRSLEDYIITSGLVSNTLAKLTEERQSNGVNFHIGSEFKISPPKITFVIMATSSNRGRSVENSQTVYINELTHRSRRDRRSLERMTKEEMIHIAFGRTNGATTRRDLQIAYLTRNDLEVISNIMGEIWPRLQEYARENGDRSIRYTSARAKVGYSIDHEEDRFYGLIIEIKSTNYPRDFPHRDETD